MTEISCEVGVEAGDTYVDVVFDGPPDHEAGRFVEVEQADGSGVKLGNWVQRDDGYWALRITREDVERVLCDTAEPAESEVEAACRAFYEEPSGLTSWDRLVSKDVVLADRYREFMGRALRAAKEARR